MGNSYDERRQFGRHTQVFQNARGGRPLGPPHTQFRDNEMRMRERPHDYDERGDDERGYGGRGYEDPSWYARESMGERGFRDAMRIDRGGRYGMRASNRYGTRDDGMRGVDPRALRERGWHQEDEDRLMMRGERPDWMTTDRSLDDERRGMMQQAQFRGKGPRNYKRSDSRIMEDVYDALTYQDDLDATDVEVSVESGEVILRGEVNSRQEKRMAEDLAHNIRGVHDVRNEIRVRREAQSASTETQPAQAQSQQRGNGASNGTNGASKQR